MAKWLSNAAPIRQRLGEAPTPDEAARPNVLLQLGNLATYPVIKSRLAAGTLRLHAWFFDIRTSELLEWNEHKADFTLLARSPSTRLSQVIKAS